MIHQEPSRQDSCNEGSQQVFVEIYHIRKIIFELSSILPLISGALMTSVPKLKHIQTSLAKYGTV